MEAIWHTDIDCCRWGLGASENVQAGEIGLRAFGAAGAAVGRVGSPPMGDVGVKRVFLGKDWRFYVWVAVVAVVLFCTVWRERGRGRDG